jgi:hypothetical protein
MREIECTTMAHCNNVCDSLAGDEYSGVVVGESTSALGETRVCVEVGRFM